MSQPSPSRREAGVSPSRDLQGRHENRRDTTTTMVKNLTDFNQTHLATTRTTSRSCHCRHQPAAQHPLPNRSAPDANTLKSRNRISLVTKRATQLNFRISAAETHRWPQSVRHTRSRNATTIPVLLETTTSRTPTSNRNQFSLRPATRS